MSMSTIQFLHLSLISLHTEHGFVKRVSEIRADVDGVRRPGVQAVLEFIPKWA